MNLIYPLVLTIQHISYQTSMKLIELDGDAVVDIYLTESSIIRNKLQSNEFIAMNDFYIGEEFPAHYGKALVNALTNAMKLGAELVYIKRK